MERRHYSTFMVFFITAQEKNPMFEEILIFTLNKTGKRLIPNYDEIV